jgi:hypothetical protein
MDLRDRMAALELAGLTGLSAWHNGDHWVAAVSFHHGLTDVGHGDTSSSAILAAFAEGEANRGKTPAERWPDEADRFAALAANPALAAEMDFDGY